MLDFALIVYQVSGRVGGADYEALRAHGFCNGDAWNIGAIFRPRP
jgi:hypothetical protein